MELISILNISDLHSEISIHTSPPSLSSPPSASLGIANWSGSTASDIFDDGYNIFISIGTPCSTSPAAHNVVLLMAPFMTVLSAAGRRQSVLDGIPSQYGASERCAPFPPRTAQEHTLTSVRLISHVLQIAPAPAHASPEHTRSSSAHPESPVPHTRRERTVSTDLPLTSCSPLSRTAHHTHQQCCAPAHDAFACARRPEPRPRRHTRAHAPLPLPLRPLSTIRASAQGSARGPRVHAYTTRVLETTDQQLYKLTREV